MSAAAPDRPDLLALPPVLYAIALLALFALRWAWPLPIAASPVTIVVGAALIVLGLAFGIPGNRALAAAGTSVDPRRPTTVLVQVSSYRYSRNPLYVGLSAVFLGIGAIANSWWAAFLTVPLLVAMHVCVIRREERYLEAKFADAYRDYCARVRRYL